MDKLEPEVRSRIEKWLKWDQNEATRHEVEELVRSGDHKRLKEVMSTDLKFGTAGLRAAMGAGFARMNDLTVIQAAQGLAEHVLEVFSAEQAMSRGIIIGYDARHNSKRFARLSANVFLSRGIKTLLFRQITPTPFVPFGLTLFNCLAGVMVTASHNPKEDNGYKVYWENGAQIVSPLDKKIAASIRRHCVPHPSSWVLQKGAVDVFDGVYEAYFERLRRSVLHYRVENGHSPLLFTYTAMHGVGERFATKALIEAGFSCHDHVVYVEQQIVPDPEFPTVQFPNPEEGKSSLLLSFAAADPIGSGIIVANDPDADRLAIAERIEAKATAKPSLKVVAAAGREAWRVFTGNQIGALLGWWALHCHRRFNPDVPLSQCAMLSSFVSSSILKTMAAVEGFYFEETLTGFKYMGNRADALRKGTPPRKVLFSFEEAIGFMFGDNVLDKDGVSAAAVSCEMAAYLDRVERKTLWQKLQEIYQVYGIHVSYNNYVFSYDGAVTRRIFAEMRTMDKKGNGFPKQVNGANVLRVRDLGTGVDTGEPDRKAKLPCFPDSPVITFYFDNNIVLTFRGSGTEPKLKWYSEIIGSKSPDAEKELQTFVNGAAEQLVQINKFNLKRRVTEQKGKL